MDSGQPLDFERGWNYWTGFRGRTNIGRRSWIEQTFGTSGGEAEEGRRKVEEADREPIIIPREDGLVYISLIGRNREPRTWERTLQLYQTWIPNFDDT